MAIRDVAPPQPPTTTVPARRLHPRPSPRQLPPSPPPEAPDAPGMLVEAVDRAGTFRLIGELDCSTIRYVRDVLRQPMLRPGRLTLDLSQLTFMGSEGIHLFTGLARERDGIGVVVLSRPGGIARRVLGIAQLDELPNLRIDSAAGSAQEGDLELTLPAAPSSSRWNSIQGSSAVETAPTAQPRRKEEETMRASVEFDRYPCFPTRALPSTEATGEKAQGMGAGASPYEVPSALRRRGQRLLRRFVTTSRARRDAGV